MTFKDIRKTYRLTQKAAAKIVEVSLRTYAEAVPRQEAIYPGNYVKLRCLETHDRARAAHLMPDDRILRNWTAFNYFQKGITMLYAGQEVCAPHTPSLFNKDTIQGNTGKDLTPLMRRLAEITRDPVFADSSYEVKALPREILVATHESREGKLVGVFSTRGEAALVETGLADGTYVNLISSENIDVRDGKAPTHGEPIILKSF